MALLTVTTKGQITLRKEILAHLGVAPGQKIDVEVLPGARVAVRAAPQSPIQNFVGCIKPPATTKLSLEDIDRVISEGWSKE